MAKKSSSGGKHGSGSPLVREQEKEATKLRARGRRRRRLVTGGVLALLGVGVVATVLATVNQEDRQTRDLTLVGTGVPAVVQVHDITCPVCSELRANVESIEDEFSDEVLVLRVADVATETGLAFARRYTGNRRVTLLYFDGEGNLVDEQVGLQSPEELRDSFTEHANR